MENNHPDILALEALRTGEGSEADQNHVRRCDACLREIARLDRMARKIKGLSAGPRPVPDHIDRAVLAMAAQRIKRPQARKIFSIRTVAAAASVLISVAAVVLLFQVRRHESAVVVKADIDRNGVVNIVDAYTMARRIHRAEPLPREWDLNGDGRVDAKDIDLVVRASTALPYRSDKAESLNDARFVSLDVYIDSGTTSLAAYQFELVCDVRKSLIVGVEGGEKAPFTGAPHYDPAALSGGRIILASYTVDEGAPSGKTRVASINMLEAGPEVPDYSAKIMAVSSLNGEKINAKIEIVRKEGGK